ncbi:hypothetical protein [Chryseosolibacter indicus]|uniref:Uncharacterized protein n=1 Tax=Chryseosolibacter indicus TaxID=2782351 RepID=A0ABS5VTR5_9BACT|nr:hypothetical protein [Chryseosolibacter indicus]MBT1703381.1 hypothetical protein [Chryseosolibacter indicus]
MIIYGWNSFKLDECKPSQLGLSPELDGQFRIERRQKYFHLFWIPFFGIGKIWALRKSDGNLYEPTAQLKSLLDALPLAHKTPWYTYSLFFVLVVGGLLFYVSDSISSYNRRISYQKYRAEFNNKLTSAVNQTVPGTHFRLRLADNYEKYAYLKYLRSDAEYMTCLYTGLKNRDYSDNEMLEAFVVASEKEAFDTVKIKKSDLLHTLNTKDEYSFKGHTVIQGLGNMIFDEMEVYTFPVFKNVAVQYQEGRFFAIIQNIGAGGKVKEFTPEPANLELDKSIYSEQFKQGGVVVLEGKYNDAEPVLRAKMQVNSESDSTTQYDLTIRGTYLALKQSTR